MLIVVSIAHMPDPPLIYLAPPRIESHLLKALSPRRRVAGADEVNISHTIGLAVSQRHSILDEIDRSDCASTIFPHFAFTLSARHDQHSDTSLRPEAGAESTNSR